MVFHGSKGSQKLCESISTDLPIQEVLMYPMKYASVLHVQKLCLVHLANSTKRNFLGLQQLDLVGMYFYPHEVGEISFLPPCFLPD